MGHSGVNGRQAIALRQSLIEQNAPLDYETFLDPHRDTGIRSGERWKDALWQANTRCEAAICLLSANWEAPPECKVEYRLTEYLSKRIFSTRMAPLTAEDPTREWLWVDLFGLAAKPTLVYHLGPRPCRVYF